MSCFIVLFVVKIVCRLILIGFIEGKLLAILITNGEYILPLIPKLGILRRDIQISFAFL